MAKTGTTKAAGSLSKRGLPSTETTTASTTLSLSLSQPSSKPISYHLVSVNPTAGRVSSSINTNGKVSKRVRRLAKRRSPLTSMTKVFKMSDLAHHHVSTGTGTASASAPFSFDGYSFTQTTGARTIIQHDNRGSSKSNSSDGNDGDGDLLFKHLCFALSNSTNQDRTHGKDDSSVSPLTYRDNRNRRGSITSITSITSTISNSSSGGGQFGFLALGPLSPSSPCNSSNSRTAPSAPRKKVIEATEAEKEVEEEEGRMEDERLVSFTTTMMTTVPSPILSPRYEPTLEELETMVYSNPLDFNPEEFVPLQLGEDDFLPIFEDISCTDDWQQGQQQQQEQGRLPIPFISELSLSSLRLPPSLSLSTLLSPSSSDTDFEMDGFWDTVLPQSRVRRYNDCSAITTGPRATGTTNESYFAILSTPPPSSASCLFEYMYDAAGHTALPQTMQQQDSLPIPVLTSSSHPNPNLNGLPVQFSSYLGSTIEFEMASASTPAPAYIPIVSTPVLARNTKHYIDLLATKKPATFQP